MVRYRKILRLAAMGVSQESIAFSCKCAQSTVSDVLRAARAHQLSWPLPEEMDDATIRAIIYPKESRRSRDKAAIDHERIASELNRRGMTMSLLWNECCDGAIARGEEPYMYSAFCREHREWAQRHDVRMRIEHKPAESIQVDWVGDTGEVIDPDTGEVLKVYVFAARLPYSNYLYAEGFYRTDEEAWIAAHVHMLSFFGGSTPILVPDNCKTAITRNAKEALIVNDQYRRMSEHYGCAVVPARVRRPRDKASVEMGVGIIERQAMMALRKRRFMSLAEHNAALIAQVMAVNSRPFQKREGSRESEYLGQEKGSLIPLPAHPYRIVVHKSATVQFNYHVAFEGMFYSVPFTCLRKKADIADTATALAIAVDAMLRSRTVEQQAYRTCRALLDLGRRHGDDVLEEACSKALGYSRNPSYKTVKTIAAKLASDKPGEPDGHAYLRGSEYYDGAGTDGGGEEADGNDEEE